MTHSHVIITGASGVLGRALVALSLKAGHSVCAVIGKTPIDVFHQTIGLPASFDSNRLLVIKTDLTRSSAASDVTARVVSAWKKIDVLIQCIGSVCDTLLLSLQRSAWDSVLKTNTTSIFHMMQAVLPHFIRAKEGHIINVSSLSSLMGRKGQAAYAASKAALNALTLSAAQEYGRFNVRANIVFPGFIPEGMGKYCSAKAQEEILKASCLKRFSDVHEVAAFILFLSQTNQISGQVFNIDSRIIPL